jgi:hypothetical protein
MKLDYFYLPESMRRRVCQEGNLRTFQCLLESFLAIEYLYYHSIFQNYGKLKFEQEATLKLLGCSKICCYYP